MRRQVLALVVLQVLDRPALARRGEQGREIELVVLRAEDGEQVEHRVVGLVRLGVRAVELVDDDDRAQAEGQRLAW